jgi:2-polyprenyl-3-methyl-5-hydroxy-6-metoxy-1,4-benzoquinol methylase
MSLLNTLADNKDNSSLSHKMRTKRFSFFLSLIKDLPRPISILDIGGTTGFWEAMNFNEEGISITLLNLTRQPVSIPGITSVAGDATDLKEFSDQSFDIVFSNSVIEHLFTYANQKKMASEVQRVGKHYFIQTPNYWFPIEPHWVFPLFQYLPFSAKVSLTQHFSLGHIKKIPSKKDAEEQVKEVRLISLNEMKNLFPEGIIYKEKILGFNKSFVAYKF